VNRVVTILAVVSALVAPIAAQEVYKPGNGVKAPVLVREVKPVYTKDAKTRGLQGRVDMECVIETDGTVADDVKVTSSLDPELDEQAIIAVRQWRFRPGTKDDQPVRVLVNIEMTFTLK